MKTSVLESLFNKVAGLKGLWQGCFPVNFVKLLETPFLTEHLRWLLLYVVASFSFTSMISTVLRHLLQDTGNY